MTEPFTPANPGPLTDERFEQIRALLVEMHLDHIAAELLADRERQAAELAEAQREVRLVTAKRDSLMREITNLFREKATLADAWTKALQQRDQARAELAAARKRGERFAAVLGEIATLAHSVNDLDLTPSTRAEAALAIQADALRALREDRAASSGTTPGETEEPRCVCGHPYAAHTDPTWANGLVTAYGAGCQCGRCSIYRAAELVSAATDTLTPAADPDAPIGYVPNATGDTQADAHAWTGHDHPCCAQCPPLQRPRRAERCGGPRKCQQCADDRDRTHATPGGTGPDEGGEVAA